MMKINICGDFVDANRGREAIKSNKAFSKEITNIFKDGDINIVNLECPIVDKNSGVKIIKTGPHLNGSEDILPFLKKNNIHLLTLANNHIRDYGDEGINNTISLCRKYDINYVGVCDDGENGAGCITMEVNGRKIAVYNYCESEFSVTTLKGSRSAAPINPCSNYCDIIEAKKEGFFNIVILHCGVEMNQYPSLQTKQLCRFYVDMGADAVICHHSHCYSGYELYNNSPIFYSIGNLYFDNPAYRNSIWNEGYIVQLLLDEKFDFKVIPYIQCSDDPIVTIMKDEIIEKFYRKLEEINEVINDSDLLKTQFESWQTKRSRYYLSSCVTFWGSGLQKLILHKYLPILLNKQNALLLFDLVRCESHRNLLVRSLEKYIYKK